MTLKRGQGASVQGTKGSSVLVVALCIIVYSLALGQHGQQGSNLLRTLLHYAESIDIHSRPFHHYLKRTPSIAHNSEHCK